MRMLCPILTSPKFMDADVLCSFIFLDSAVYIEMLGPFAVPVVFEREAQV